MPYFFWGDARVLKRMWRKSAVNWRCKCDLERILSAYVCVRHPTQVINTEWRRSQKQHRMFVSSITHDNFHFSFPFSYSLFHTINLIYDVIKFFSHPLMAPPAVHIWSVGRIPRNAEWEAIVLAYLACASRHHTHIYE